MICKVYGYEIKHCACEKQECCIMESCAKCMTVFCPSMLIEGIPKETEECKKEAIQCV